MYNRYIRNEQGAYSRIPQQEPPSVPEGCLRAASLSPRHRGLHRHRRVTRHRAVLRREGRRPSRRSHLPARRRDGFWTGCCPGSIWGTSTPGICCFC